MEQIKELYDVFISYRRKEIDGDPLGTRFAIELSEFLRACGLRVFLDTEKMDHGKDFVEQIKSAIINTPHYMLIATPGAFEYRGEDEMGRVDYVREEMKLACSLFKENRTIHIFNSPGFKYIEEQYLPDFINNTEHINREMYG